MIYARAIHRGRLRLEVRVRFPLLPADQDLGEPTEVARLRERLDRHGNQLHERRERHADQSDDHAHDPLPPGEGSRGGKVPKELHDNDLPGTKK